MGERHGTSLKNTKDKERKQEEKKELFHNCHHIKTAFEDL